jgi:hypothetical protein
LNTLIENEIFSEGYPISSHNLKDRPITILALTFPSTYLSGKNSIALFNGLFILKYHWHWFSLIEGRKSYWAKVREIKKPI